MPDRERRLHVGEAADRLQRVVESLLRDQQLELRLGGDHLVPVAGRLEIAQQLRGPVPSDRAATSSARRTSTGREVTMMSDSGATGARWPPGIGSGGNFPIVRERRIVRVSVDG
jgi:hypothetical protein